MNPEFERNRQINDIVYDQEIIGRTPTVVIGDNILSRRIISQLLAVGFKEIYCWGRNSRNLMKEVSHISPFYRENDNLEAKIIPTSFDQLGFEMFQNIFPSIIINTENNSFISDIMIAKTNDLLGQSLFIDAHTVYDHPNKLYGLNIQTAANIEGISYDQFQYLEERDISIFEKKEHDPFLSIICASFAASYATRYALGKKDYFCEPTSFTLFPFSEDEFSAEPAPIKVDYDGFFGDKKIVVAGLGGGSLIVESLINIFNVENLIGIDTKRIKTSNFNRLVPLAYQKNIGKMKTEANQDRYAEQIKGRNIDFINHFIQDNLFPESMIGVEPEIIFGCLSGFDNKLNLAAISQSMKQPHILVDLAAEPFRVDITNWANGVTPCDYCRNLHDLAVKEYLSDALPECDRLPIGSTVFSNYLASMGLIEAMKYTNPVLGDYATGSITLNLNSSVFNPNEIYQKKESETDPEICRKHMRTEPITINPTDFIIEEGMNMGWNQKIVYEKTEGGKGRLVTTFRYVPNVK